MAEDLFIIAIELGSSHATGIGGKKMPDGSIQIEAVAQEPSSAFIRKGMIFNMDKSTQCVRVIKKRIEDQLKRSVTQVYVGFGGQSLHSMHNSIMQRFDEQKPISKQIVDDLMKENVNTNIGDLDILEVIPQEYSVGTQKQIDPVGVLSDYIEGRYLNLTARTALRTNIDNCFANVGIHIVEDKLIPLTVADEVLSDTEKRSGCVLVDFGADTTTISIYKANLLRFLSVIPLGSSNITKDIMSCQLEETDAEGLKLRYGIVATDLTEDQSKEIIYTLPDGSTITKGKLYDIVEARMEEILYNVKAQIAESGFGRDSLVAGAWLIGGGANLKNLSKAFTDITGFDKVRIVKNPRQTIHFAKNLNKNTDGQLLSVISLLTKGTQSCTSPLIQEQAAKVDIFDSEEPQNGAGSEEHENNVNSSAQETKSDKEESPKKGKDKHKGPSLFKKAIKRIKDISTVIVGDED